MRSGGTKDRYSRLQMWKSRHKSCFRYFSAVWPWGNSLALVSSSVKLRNFPELPAPLSYWESNKMIVTVISMVLCYLQNTSGLFRLVHWEGDGKDVVNSRRLCGKAGVTQTRGVYAYEASWRQPNLQWNWNELVYQHSRYKYGQITLFPQLIIPGNACLINRKFSVTLWRSPIYTSKLYEIIQGLFNL